MNPAGNKTTVRVQCVKLLSVPTPDLTGIVISLQACASGVNDHSVDQHLARSKCQEQNGCYRDKNAHDQTLNKPSISGLGCKAPNSKGMGPRSIVPTPHKHERCKMPSYIRLVHGIQISCCMHTDDVSVSNTAEETKDVHAGHCCSGLSCHAARSVGAKCAADSTNQALGHVMPTAS